MKTLLALACALVLAACGGGSSGKPESSASRKAAQPPWDAAANAFVAAGWKSGDQASWQAQMVRRAQSQNEFLRVN
jgi:ABC-type glycerol-3-phosphate transport system substrate-binding protein